MSYIGTTELGKMFLGNVEIEKAYLGNDLVFQEGTGPSPIIGTPYIRGGDNGSYIDTGITADNTTRVIVWARNFTPNSGVLFGSRIGLSNSAFVLGTYGDTNIGRLRFDYGNSMVYSDDQFSNLSHYHKYEIDGNVLKVDDVTLTSATSATFSNNLNIHLLSLNNNGTNAANSLPIDLCACKIYKGGVLVRDFTAVNSPSVGLYDSVSRMLFTNAGSGSFTYGTFEEDAYVPLSYVSCTSQQYIDMGVYGTASLPIVCKFRIVGASMNYPDLFGTMRNGVSGTYLLLEFGNTNYKNRYAYFYVETNSAKQLYNNNSTKLTNLDVVFVKDSTSAQLVRNNATIGTKSTFSVSSSFSTSPDTMMLGTLRNTSGVSTNYFSGYIYFMGLGKERNFVPAKVNNIAGLYDTYNDVFYRSISGNDFIAGTEL